jgi:hypothetical protein
MTRGRIALSLLAAAIVASLLLLRAREPGSAAPRSLTFQSGSRHDRNSPSGAGVDLANLRSVPDAGHGAPRRARTDAQEARDGLESGDAAARPSPTVVEVTVRRADGSPVTGATVRVFESAPAGGGICGEPRELPPERGRARTRRDGTARIEIDGPVWGCFVSAARGDDAALTSRPAYLKSGERLTADLVLSTSRRIRGSVVDAEGRPVENAAVLLLVTDPIASATSSIGRYAFAVPPDSATDGSFEFAAVGEMDDAQRTFGRQMSVRARAEGFVPAEVSISADAAEACPVLVRLVRACADARNAAIGVDSPALDSGALLRFGAGNRDAGERPEPK